VFSGQGYTYTYVMWHGYVCVPIIFLYDVHNVNNISISRLSFRRNLLWAIDHFDLTTAKNICPLSMQYTYQLS